MVFGNGLTRAVDAMRGFDRPWFVAGGWALDLFLGAVSRGRRRDEVDPDTARELRRNGRILLADTKALKRDVKNLQRTFSIFQR